MVLWDAQVPNKVKVHTWRLIENDLALGAELQRRRIKPGVKCIACGREESMLHRFWKCPHSAMVRKELKVGTGMLDQPPDHLKSHGELRWWMLDWLGKSSAHSIVVMLMNLYQIWLACHDARETEKIEDPRCVARRTLANLEEWDNIHQRPQSSTEKVVEHWLPPEEEWVKANADGAFLLSQGNGGGGVVLRDCHGGFLAGADHFPPHVADAECAELLACRGAVTLAKDMQVQKLLLETDCTGVLGKLVKNEMD